jgi:hypothetical protein
MGVFKREGAVFLTLLQLGGYVVLAALQWAVTGRSKRVVPVRYAHALHTLLQGGFSLHSV